MPIKYQVVATTGEYTNRNGETKKKYKNVGAIIEKDGKFYLKLDALVTMNDGGLPVNFFALYPPKEQDAQSPHQQTKSNGYQPQDDFDDSELPF